jgi:hypothetical protein
MIYLQFAIKFFFVSRATAVNRCSSVPITTACRFGGSAMARTTAETARMKWRAPAEGGRRRKLFRDPLRPPMSTLAEKTTFNATMVSFFLLSVVLFVPAPRIDRLLLVFT